MAPENNRSDHEILLAIHDDVRDIKTQMDDVRAVLHGRPGDSRDTGLIARVNYLEDANRKLTARLYTIAGGFGVTLLAFVWDQVSTLIQRTP